MSKWIIPIAAILIFVVLFFVSYWLTVNFWGDPSNLIVSIIASLLIFVVGILVGRVVELNRLKQRLVSDIDNAVNELSQLRPLNHTDRTKLYFESEAMESFCENFLQILTKRFGYEYGLFEITDASLPYAFSYSYPSDVPNPSDIHMPNSAMLEAVKTIAIRSAGNIEHLSRNSFIKRLREYVSGPINLELPFTRIVIVPIAHTKNEVLGYFALMSNRQKPQIREIAFFEDELLANIENMKIDDAVKFFIERQRLLLVIGAVRILDSMVYEKIVLRKIDDAIECGKSIVLTLTKTLKLSAGFIYLSNEKISSEARNENPYIYVENNDEAIREQIRDEFLMPYIQNRRINWPEKIIYKNITNFVRQPKFSFEFFISCPISSTSVGYGMIGFLAERKFTRFDKELLRDLENFKIDDCFSILDRRKNTLS